MANNKYSCTPDTAALIMDTAINKCYNTFGDTSNNKNKKKSRYFKLQKQLNELENKYDILDTELLEFKFEIDDIRNKLIKYKSKYNISSGSEFEYEVEEL
jgi:septal ring factor EnvC (AmiA/AmiB activator)